jgi:hypothetical protein
VETGPGGEVSSPTARTSSRDHRGTAPRTRAPPARCAGSSSPARAGALAHRYRR